MKIKNTLLSGLNFRFKVKEISVALEIIDITCSDFLLKIISPDKYKGFPILGLHIPGWGYPTVHGGYLYDKTLLMPKFFERMLGLVECFFEEHELFKKEIVMVRTIYKDSADEEEISKYFWDNFNVMYNVHDLPYFLDFYNITGNEK